MPQTYVLFILVAAGLLVAGLASTPWRTLTVIAVLYLATLPFAFYSYHRLRREAERLHDGEDPDDDSGDKDDDAGPDGGAGDDEDQARTTHLRPV